MGLYQKDVASLIGVDLITVLNWEKSTTRPTIRHIHQVIQFLGYDPEPQSKGTIAEMLRAWRRERGLTQKNAARTLGIDPCTWSDWERGGTIMRLAHRQIVASLLDVPAASLHVTMKKQWNGSHGKPTR